MIRKAFIMFVNRDQHVEYKRRHDEISPDLAEVLTSHGAHNYSIFLDEETSRLYGYVECEDEARWAAIATTEPCQRWWAYMKDIMETNPDNSPKSVQLKEVFHLD